MFLLVVELNIKLLKVDNAKKEEKEVLYLHVI